MVFYASRFALALLFLFCLPSGLRAAPIFTMEESWPIDGVTEQAIERSHQKIKSETGIEMCYVLEQYEFAKQEDYLALNNGECDGFLFVMMNQHVEYMSAEFDYEYIGMGFDASRDATPTRYSFLEADFVPVEGKRNLMAIMIRDFSERFIQAENHPILYWFRELWEEATADYVQAAVINYCIISLMSLPVIFLYLFYRLITLPFQLSWKWHLALAAALPFLLIFVVAPFLDFLENLGVPSSLIFFPVAGLAYAFCAFLSTFFLGQRIFGDSDWPPYWAIFLIHLVAPLAVFAAGAAKGAAGSLGSSLGGRSSSGSNVQGAMNGGGGTFGGGGASGRW